MSKSAAERFRLQGGWCERLGSPLYARLLAETASDIEAGGRAEAIVAGHESDPPGSALALRFMGAVHRIVLEGKAPELARFYPSAGGDGDPGHAAPAFAHVLGERSKEIRRLLGRSVQTNEVGRSAALLGGFLLVARATGKPLRALEIGASAGLNLRWDRYRYEAGGESWGPPDARVRLVDAWVGKPPLFETAARVVERRGCDRSPIDATSDEGRLTLLSFVWADQMPRIALLRGAIDTATRVPVEIDRADAADWLAVQLASPAVGLATVVFHSIVLQYLSRSGRERVEKTISKAGARASEAAPLAWLRMEPGGAEAEILLTLWPGGETRPIATSGFHGRNVRWLL